MRVRVCGVAAFLAVAFTGCGGPPATVDLITAARKGLALARESQAARHGEMLRQLGAQAGTLDDAFDADVHLAAAGQLKDAQGKPLAMTPEWVISARKGYATARDALAGQVRAEDAAHTVETDNLKAADEALDMAQRLIVEQWAIAGPMQQAILNAQRRLINGR
jgi:hypothetical protein